MITRNLALGHRWLSTEALKLHIVNALVSDNVIRYHILTFWKLYRLINGGHETLIYGVKRKPDQTWLFLQNWNVCLIKKNTCILKLILKLLCIMITRNLASGHRWQSTEALKLHIVNALVSDLVIRYLILTFWKL